MRSLLHTRLCYSPALRTHGSTLEEEGSSGPGLFLRGSDGGIRPRLHGRLGPKQNSQATLNFSVVTPDFSVLKG